MYTGSIEVFSVPQTLWLPKVHFCLDILIFFLKINIELSDTWMSHKPFNKLCISNACGSQWQINITSLSVP